MNETLRTQKDNLAKLMATENLTIVHRKVPTAYFDIEKRVLCCPILKDDLSPYLYDLFMGHEVGHALHTPLEGLHSTLKENRTLKGYLNVIEDVRIERKIREKFSGLRKSFFKAYNELMDMDFFGIKDIDLQELSLIDKINLITKVGSRINIKLTDEEQVFLDDSYKCETWEDVVELAERIYEWSKENETRNETDESIKGYQYDIIEDDSDEEEEDYSETDGTDSDDEIDMDFEESDIDEPENTMTSAGAGYDDESGAREALTEHNAHNNEEQFVSDDNRKKVQIDLLPVYKSEYFRKNEFVVGYKELMYLWRDHWSKSKDQFSTWTDYTLQDGLNLAKYTAQKITNRNKKIVMHMAKEFEMKQTAKRSAKAFTGKTGQLDMNRLAKYQIVEDVFKRAVYLPDGKNHGITVLVDWSGSIQNQVSDLLEQTIILAQFCRKAQIPHRVYLFSDSFRTEYKRDDNLLEIFSNEMGSKEFSESLVNVCALWNNYTFGSNNWRGHEKFLQKWKDWFSCDFKFNDSWLQTPRFTPDRLNLGGTPLNSSIAYMRKLLPEFNKAYGIEKSILTIITDGESHPSVHLSNTKEYDQQIEDQGDDNPYAKVAIEIIDPYNRRVYLHQAEKYGSRFRDTQNLLEWLADTTGVIVTGYFVLGRKGDIWHLLNYVDTGKKYIGENNVNEIWKEIRKEGKVFNSKGYNKLFLTAATTLSVEGEDTLDDDLIDATKGRLSAAFRKNQRSKTTSRFLTNEFIKEIA